MNLLAILAGAATGIVLGVFGSGGSIITTPSLLYLLHVEPKSAIAMSLGVVAITATITAIDNWRRGTVDLRVALIFGGFGMVGTFAGARLGVYTPVAIQLGLFALVMYAAAYKMLRGKKLAPAHPHAAGDTAAAGPPHRIAHIAAHGVVVGVLTGLVGVGGGFLIVPALVLLSGIPMKRAVGTSLAIVAAKSYAGFAGYVTAVPINYVLMGSFTAVTVAGSFAGTHLAHKVSAEALKRSFAVFLLLVATYILYQTVVSP